MPKPSLIFMNWLGVTFAWLSIPIGFYLDPVISIFLIYTAIIWAGVMYLIPSSPRYIIKLSIISGLLTSIVMGSYTAKNGFDLPALSTALQSIAITIPALAIFMILFFVRESVNYFNKSRGI